MRPRRRGTDPPPQVDSTPAAARLTALRLLGRRDYSTEEMRTRLGERGYTEDDVEAAIVHLTDERLLDDARVAASHVRQASRLKARGPHRIRRELEARGFSAAVVQAALGACAPEESTDTLARIVARKTTKRPLDPDARRRLFQHLLRRGFAASAISAALRTARPGGVTGDRADEDDDPIDDGE